MTKKLDIAVGIAMAAMAVVLGVAANSYLRGEGPVAGTDVANRVAVQELLTIARGHDDTALRAWLVRQGPDATHRAILSLDNQNDKAATVRIQALRAIHSLSAEGLGSEAVKSWSVALRSLANTMLHDGPDRADFIARSYEMEGRMADAAAEYRHYPASPNSGVFFSHYPEMRAPASVASETAEPAEPRHFSAHRPGGY